MNRMLDRIELGIVKAAAMRVFWWPEEEPTMESDHVRKYLRDAGATTEEINTICNHPRMSQLVTNVVKAAECGGYECAIRRFVCKAFGVSGEIVSKIMYTKPPKGMHGYMGFDRTEDNRRKMETPEDPILDMEKR